MDLRFAATAPHETDVDLLAVLVDDPADVPAQLADADAATGGAVARELARGQVKSDAASITTVSGAASGPARIALVGFGPEKEGRADALRIAGSKVASAAHAMKAKTVALVAPDAADDLSAVVEGVVLGAFRVHHYRTAGAEGADEVDDDDADSRYEGPDTLTILAATDEDAARRSHTIATAQNWARDLANAPANLLPPLELARRARELADAHEHLAFRELDRAGIEAEGMGLLAAVAQGADDEPRVIVLEWNPPGSDEADGDRLALVGKAVTFDTGGISIKPSSGMEDMKLDKSGGCAVLGAMRAIAETGVERRVLAIVGATMNMPDGKAYRPGDVITAKDGTTVEVISTDAEGRLVLADCIALARQEGCAAIVEASTLTGAMVIALGHRYAGAIGREGALLDSLVAAARATGDHAWPMPMHDEYKADLKTGCADLKNAGARGGGALSAGAFLQHFAKDTPFVHLDVAGVAMLHKARAWYGCRGASGWGVRMMATLAGSWRA